MGYEPFKSPGPYGIFLTLLQHAGDVTRIPDGWKDVLVVFIPKSGKPSHVGHKDYKPISLSSFLLKALEKLINLYLRSNIHLSCDRFC